MTIGRIHSEESFGTLDGPGVRYVVFMQGCPNKCIYCHNPDTWSCSGGKAVTVDELMERITSCRNFIKSGGVTLSGGEPAMQKEFVLEVLKRCRQENLHTALDTSAALPLNSCRELIDEADLILLDIKGVDEAGSARLAGNSHCHKNALEILEHCQQTGKPVWIRHVLLRDLTCTEENLEKLAALLKPYRSIINKVELLPFHTMGFFKWDELNMVNPLADSAAVTPAEKARAEQIFAEAIDRLN